MGIAATLDNLSRPAWIGLLIVSFVLFWPLGLFLLAYRIGSGRMGCWKHHGGREWRQHAREWRDQWRTWKREQRAGGYRAYPSSGNAAFDEYREETLRRLEDEQQQFKDFLDQLRKAKDKAEFDQFMADRRRRDQGPQPQGPQPEPQA